jgi:hypothetical protein
VESNPNEDGRIVRAANCSFNVLTLATAEGRPAEVVHCLVNFLQCDQGRGGKVTLRHSAVNICDLLPREGESALVLERSAVWHPGPGAAFTRQSGLAKGTTAVTARATLFEAGNYLVGAVPSVRWHGSGNVYRIGSLSWRAGVEAWGLAGWRQAFQTAEEGSAVADPLRADPLRWRLKDAAGKSCGADVGRVGPAGG